MARQDYPKRDEASKVGWAVDFILRNRDRRSKGDIERDLSEAGYSDQVRAQAWGKVEPVPPVPPVLRPPVPPLPQPPRPAGGLGDARRLADYLRTNRTKYELSVLDAVVRRAGWDTELVAGAWHDLFAEEPPEPPSRAARIWNWLVILFFVVLALWALLWAASTTVTMWPATP